MSLWYLEFSQKTNDYYSTSSRIVFVRFLGEFKTPKRHFEINWPLEDNIPVLIPRTEKPIKKPPVCNLPLRGSNLISAVLTMGWNHIFDSTLWFSNKNLFRGDQKKAANLKKKMDSWKQDSWNHLMSRSF